jgi:hypothetical protein
MDSFRGRSRSIPVFVAAVFVYTAVQDANREAWLHLAAVVVLAASYSQPQLTSRRRALEFLAFALFEVSMAVVIHGIAEERGRGPAIGATVVWVIANVILAIGYVRYQRHLRTTLTSASEDADSAQ